MAEEKRFVRATWQIMEALLSIGGRFSDREEMIYRCRDMIYLPCKYDISPKGKMI